MENVTDIRHGYNSKEYICFSLLPLRFAFCYWKKSQMSTGNLKRKKKEKVSLLETTNQTLHNNCHCYSSQRVGKSWHKTS